MIPVDQVRTGLNKGQCTEACVASLLELTLGEVPSLWDPSDPPGTRDPDNFRWVRMLALVTLHGHTWVQYKIPEPVESIRDLLSKLPTGAADFTRDKSFMAGGENPDGHGHWVINKGSAMLHDPNPSRRGLINFDTVVLLMPEGTLPPEQLGWLMLYYSLQEDGSWELTG